MSSVTPPVSSVKPAGTSTVKPLGWMDDGYGGFCWSWDDVTQCQATPMSIDMYYRRQAAQIEGELGWALTTGNTDAAEQFAQDLAQNYAQASDDLFSTNLENQVDDYFKSDDYEKLSPEGRINALLGLSLVIAGDPVSANELLPVYFAGVQKGSEFDLNAAQGSRRSDPSSSTITLTDPLLKPCAILSGIAQKTCLNKAAELHFMGVVFIQYAEDYDSDFAGDFIGKMYPVENGIYSWGISTANRIFFGWRTNSSEKNTIALDSETIIFQEFEQSKSEVGFLDLVLKIVKGETEYVKPSAIITFKPVRTDFGAIR